MKTKLTTLKLLITSCCLFAAAAVFGQTPTVLTWTNASGTDLGIATNWNPNAVPNPMTPTADTNGFYGDECLFDGQSAGPVTITAAVGGFGGQSYPAGLRVHLTGNQTSPVTFYSAVSLSSGLRMNAFHVDAGSGGLILGDHSGNALDILDGELNGQPHGFTNNSTVPCVINETVAWREGGAGAHPHIFAGTGDWIVNNRMRSHNSSAILVQMQGSGTMTWTGTNTANAPAGDNIGTPVTIGNGTMIMKSSDIVNAAAGRPNIVVNSLLVFDWTPAPGIVTTPDTIPGNISGSGTIRVTNGVITFAGASTFSGAWILNGGEIIAGSVENAGVSGPLGQGGIFSLQGGIFGWNLANAVDYSSRFDTSPGQIYNFDTGGSSPTLATGLTSSGAPLTKLGGGTLALAGTNTYTGLTTINGGELLFEGPKTGTGDIIIADTAALGAFENGSQITPNTLTLGSSTGVTLEFVNVTNKTAATLVANTLVANAPVTVIVSSGTFRFIGDTFPLFKWTTGTAPAVSIGFLAGAGGHLVTNANEIDLVIDNPPFLWTGSQDALWNTTSIDWIYNGLGVAWVNGNYSLLDDSSTVSNLTLVGSIQPTNVTINISANAYDLTNSAGNKLTGPGSLTKNGNGTLALPGGANDYTGVTLIGGGVVAVSALGNGGAASDIGAANNGNTNIVLANGGTLQYTGSGATIDRLFSVGQNGGAIDNEGAAPLILNNSGTLGMSGNGPRSLTLTGPNIGDTIAAGITNHPAGTSLIKDGTGTWILTGTNTFAGGTQVKNGILQVGATGGGASGTLGGGNISVASGAEIDFQRTGTLTVPGAVSGAGSVVVDGTGTVILANNNSYSGGTTINAGTLQVGTGGGAGSLYSAGNIVNNSLLIFNTSGSFFYGAGANNGVISGTGNVIVQGGGIIKAIGNHTYTGWTRIDANTVWQPIEGQDGAMSTSAITNNGTLRMTRQDSLITYPGPIVGTGKVYAGANNVNIGVITFTGTNTYSGGTLIGGNTLVLGDGATAGAGAIPTNSTITFTNNFGIVIDNVRTLEFNRPVGDDFIFTGNIVTNFSSPQANLGVLQLQGGANVTLTGNNTYGGGTVINGGQLTIGNGGSTGSVGFGGVTNNVTTPLVINRTGNLSIPGAIAGTGGLTLINSATVTLSSPANTYTGDTIVSNGTLVVSSLGGNLELDGGTVIVKGTPFVANLNVPGNLTINSGTLVGTLNRLLSPSNTTYTVTGAITYNGGTLELFTTGQALNPGDNFKIFSGPVVNGGAMPIVSPGCTLQNNLATDGSVTVLTAQPLPTTLSFGVSSRTNFVVSWPPAWTGGVHLQTQANSLKIGLSNNWVNVAGINSVNSYTNVIGTSSSSACVFYRLVIP